MNRPKLIIVDDEEDLLQLSGFILEEDFNIIGTAKDGNEAIQLLKNIEDKPDIVLLDVLLPNKNGFEVCKWIKDNLPKIKVVLFTVKGSEEDITTGKNAGADAHIVKPTARREILQTIHKTLNE